MSGKRNVTLEQGKTYKNRGGGTFRCLQVGGFLRTGDATVQNVASGWTCTAHGVTMYEDSTIEWDYSTGGRFESMRAAG